MASSGLRKTLYLQIFKTLSVLVLVCPIILDISVLNGKPPICNGSSEGYWFVLVGVMPTMFMADVMLIVADGITSEADGVMTVVDVITTIYRKNVAD